MCTKKNMTTRKEKEVPGQESPEEKMEMEHVKMLIEIKETRRKKLERTPNDRERKKEKI